MTLLKLSTMTAKRTIVIALVSGGALAFFYWRHQALSQAWVAQLIAVGDRSVSVTNSALGVLAIGRRALEQPGMGRGSTLTVMATGDETMAYEPVLVARYEVPTNRRALEGKNAKARRKEEILSDLEAQWKALQPTRSSPIFLAVKRGVEQLRSSGCTPERTCYLFVKTDGEELTEPGIKAALRGSRSKGLLPKPIDNKGIRIVLCGLSETVGGKNEKGRTQRYTEARQARRIDRVCEVWTALFTNPELVSFEPYCQVADTAKLDQK